MSLTVDHSLDGQSRYTEIVAILIAGSVLSTAAVAARAFTRLFLLHTFGVDDAIMVVAQVRRNAPGSCLRDRPELPALSQTRGKAE